MSWATDMTQLLRVLVNDMEEEISLQTYSDQRLRKVLVTSAYMVLQDADFSQEFSADIDTLEITPDPTESATEDRDLINLVVLKAACIVDKGEARSSTSQGFSFKDENVSFDGRNLAAARLAILQNGGWCKTYDDSLEAYRLSLSGDIAAAVMGPFRVYSYGIGSRPGVC